MATACHWLGGSARGGAAWLAENLDWLIPPVFPATGALLRGTRVTQSRALAHNNCPIQKCQNMR
jgi:hypothetical protein